MAFLEESTWRGKVYSGGWRTAAGGDAPVTEPATGEELGRTGIAGPADVAAADTAAAAAQAAWAATPHTERAALLRRAGDIWKVGRHVGQLAAAHLKRCHLELGGNSALARRIPTGIVHINDQTVDDAPNTPFGGIFASGTGARFGGTANLDAFTDTRWVTMRGDIAPYPF
jgi:acyl-CoA reductase-like NAD-dependent aldehyde dehydrogenase